MDEKGAVPPGASDTKMVNDGYPWLGDTTAARNFAVHRGVESCVASEGRELRCERGAEIKPEQSIL